MPMKLIIANWKENPDSLEDAHKLIKISNNFKLDILQAVPYIFANELAKENTEILLQDISKFENGSHTGEVSYKMAKNIGIFGSIVGHSERRESRINIHGDRDEDINQKLKNLLANDLVAVLCVGEEVRENMQKVLELQIVSDLKSIDTKFLEKLVIAYEPIWAIGEAALRAASAQEILESLNFVKSSLEKKFDKEVAGKIKILYGGSVDENNVEEILKIGVCDGVLVGRASSDPTKWQKLLEKINSI